ncbi:hypothetical protein K402DRAFT_326571, partial [Aulographum hederae CBS 113979]
MPTEELRLPTGPSASSESASTRSSEHYERRPRHKTRPEKYEPRSDKERERKRRGRAKKGDESKKRDKTSKRKRKKGKSGTDVSHNFHAKNVAQDRLTLKPRASLGLFKKGRTSNPAKGQGLPDLVFSEMHFLQKRDHNDEQSKHGPVKKSRKKDAEQAKQEDISAYFASKRPPLAE